jgi:hypothetical protein
VYYTHINKTSYPVPLHLKLPPSIIISVSTGVV